MQILAAFPFSDAALDQARVEGAWRSAMDAREGLAGERSRRRAREAGVTTRTPGFSSRCVLPMRLWRTSSWPVLAASACGDARRERADPGSSRNDRQLGDACELCA